MSAPAANDPRSPGADDRALKAKAEEILDHELRALECLRAALEPAALGRAVELLCACRGRIIVSGVGKTGIIGQRIAASLRSTGVPAFFIHPVEAIHGDLGLVERSDAALLLSRSGETDELLSLLPTLRRIGIPIIALVSRSDSSLARQADVHLTLGPIQELPDLGEFPTTSTTVFQVLGDILVALVFGRRGIGLEDLRFLHPGGVLGRRAALRVRDVMHTGGAIPTVKPEQRLREALVEIMEKRLGMTCVVDGDGRLCGILTDGDIKRILHRHGEIRDLSVGEVMTPRPKTVGADELLVTALNRMENNPGGAITSLIVTGEGGVPIGVVHIHDILRAEPQREG